MAVVLNDILTDLRTRYDLSENESNATAKLTQYIAEAVDDISARMPGALNLRSGDFAVQSDQTLTLPSAFDQVLLVYFNSIEIPVIDLADFTKWNQEFFYNDYAVTVELDETSGDYKIKTNGLGVGSEVTVVYTVRTSALTSFPSIFRYPIMYGAAYKYEKFEQRLQAPEYSRTYKEFDDRLNILKGKQFNNMQLTLKQGSSHVVERLKQIL